MEGKLVFAPAVTGPLFSVAEGGGEPTPVTRLENPNEEISHRFPAFLPDGRRFLYIAQSATGGEGGPVYLASLDGGERRLLLRTRRAPIYADPGYLIFAIDNHLAAQPFDPKAGALEGEPRRLAELTPAYVNTQDRVASASSTEGETIFRSAYESALRLWPVPHESVYVFSRFGITHVIVSGNPQGKPLILLHGALAGSTMWFPQADVLSRNNRLYAVDILGDVNLSVPIYLPKDRVETTEWLTAVFDELGIEQATVMGISLGGFLALDLALSAPQRVNRIVVLDPAASLAPYSLSFMFRTIPNILAGFFSEHPMDSIVKWATEAARDSAPRTAPSSPSSERVRRPGRPTS